MKNPENKKFAPKNPKNGHSTKSKGGRPPIILCEKDIEDLAAIGCTDDEIARFVGCSESIVKDKYSASLQKGRDRMRSSIRRVQLDEALKGRNTAMLIWMGKVYCGQTDKQDITHSGIPNLQVINFGTKEPLPWKSDVVTLDAVVENKKIE